MTAVRSCDKASCGRPAAASLSFRYATCQVWILTLSDDPDPHHYDLCAEHADLMTVPRGWERVDQRRGVPVSDEPETEEVAEAVDVGAQTANRYAALAAELPRIAAEVARETPIEATGTGDAVATGPVPVHLRVIGPSGSPSGTQGRGAVVPSRDLAPTPSHTPSPGVHPSQRSERLVRPADDEDGVVVSLHAARLFDEQDPAADSGPGEGSDEGPEPDATA